MRRERRYYSLLRRRRGFIPAFFLYATLAVSLAVMAPESAFADSKLKEVVEDLVKQQAELEVTQTVLKQQIAALEAREIVLLGELDQLRSGMADLKEESKRAQLAEEEARQEAERQAAVDNYIVAMVSAAIVTTIAGGGQSTLPSETALYNAKLILGDTIYESIQAGDYIFLDFLASKAIDTDGDGIPDGIDFCPYEYGTLTLMGCPVQYSD